MKATRSAVVDCALVSTLALALGLRSLFLPSLSQDEISAVLYLGALALFAIALAGIRGREAEASALIDRVVADATAGAQGAALQYAHWARSVLMNGLGRYEDALAAAMLATGQVPDHFVASWGLSELIEGVDL